jgi:hypothetical protein
MRCAGKINLACVACLSGARTSAPTQAEAGRRSAAAHAGVRPLVCWTRSWCTCPASLPAAGSCSALNACVWRAAVLQWRRQHPCQRNLAPGLPLWQPARPHGAPENTKKAPRQCLHAVLACRACMRLCQHNKKTATQCRSALRR